MDYQITCLGANLSFSSFLGEWGGRREVNKWYLVVNLESGVVFDYDMKHAVSCHIC